MITHNLRRTPHLSKADQYWNSVVTYMQFEGANGSKTFIDSSNKHTYLGNTSGMPNDQIPGISSFNNPVISTNKFVTGTSSLYFDGNSSLPIISSVADQLGTGDFTIEMRLYPTKTDYAPHGTIIGTNNLQISEDYQQIHAQYNSVLYTGTSILPNMWTHVAIVRQNKYIKIYLNGTASAGGSTYEPNGITWITVGGFGVYGSFWTGYMDELRITKDVARYTSNFIVDNESYPTN